MRHPSTLLEVSSLQLSIWLTFIVSVLAIGAGAVEVLRQVLRLSASTYRLDLYESEKRNYNGSMNLCTLNEII